MKKWSNFLLTTVNIILYLVALSTWIAIPDELTLNIATSVAALALTAGLVIANRNTLEKYYLSTQFRGFVSALTGAFLIFCIIGLLNYLSFKHPTQFDFSSNKTRTLTEQTRSVLSQLDEKLEVYIFSQAKQMADILRLVELYRLEKNDLQIEFVDVELRPEMVAQFKVTQAPSLVVKYGKRTRIITKIDELNITNALIKISREKDPVIYYLTGHGEGDLNDIGNEGYKVLKDALTNSNYIVRELNLVSAKLIPNDADALMLWGPVNGLHSGEIKLLDDYITAGGKLVIALNPQLKEDKFKNLRNLLVKRGLGINNDLVIDSKNHVSGSNGSVPIVSEFSTEHIITNGFVGPVFFPLVSSIQKVELENELGIIKLLAKSSEAPHSWAEKNSDEMLADGAKFTPGVDQQGPIAMAATWQKVSTDQEQARGKIVVFGNSTFLVNAYSRYGSNYTMLLNSISWLVDQEGIISFNLPVVENGPVFISAPQLGVIFYFSVILLPLLMFGMAGFTFYQRRKAA